MQDKVKFLMLCWRAYNGDIQAGAQALRIIHSRATELGVIEKLMEALGKIADSEK